MSLGHSVHAGCKWVLWLLQAVLHPGHEEVFEARAACRQPWCEWWEAENQPRSPGEHRAGFQSLFPSSQSPDPGLNVTSSSATRDLPALIPISICRASALSLLALPSMRWGISTFWA